MEKRVVKRPSFQEIAEQMVINEVGRTRSRRASRKEGRRRLESIKSGPVRLRPEHHELDSRSRRDCRVDAEATVDGFRTEPDWTDFMDSEAASTFFSRGTSVFECRPTSFMTSVQRSPERWPLDDALLHRSLLNFGKNIAR